MGKSRQGRVNRLELAGMNNFSCFVLEVVFSCLVSPEIIGFGGGLVAESCLTLATLAAVACQAPLSIGFPRQESWSGLPVPPPGHLPNPGIKPETFPRECFGLENAKISPFIVLNCLNTIYSILVITYSESYSF